MSYFYRVTTYVDPHGCEVYDAIVSSEEELSPQELREYGQGWGKRIALEAGPLCFAFGRRMFLVA